MLREHPQPPQERRVPRQRRPDQEEIPYDEQQKPGEHRPRDRSATLPAVLAACSREDAPIADFVINCDSVVPITNTGPPPPASLDLVVSIGPKTLPDTGSPDRQGASCDPREPTRPDAKPYIEDLFVAPDGKLWAEVVRTAGNRWEVFDADGMLIAGVAAPPRRENVVPAFGPDYLLTIRRDSLDLDHIESLAA